MVVRYGLITIYNNNKTTKTLESTSIWCGPEDSEIADMLHVSSQRQPARAVRAQRPADWQQRAGARPQQQPTFSSQELAWPRRLL